MAAVTSERIKLQDTTCPLMRLNTARRKDKSVSFSLSLLVHITIFFFVGISLINPVEFGIEKGEDSVEINLVASPSESASEYAIIPPVEEKTDFVDKAVEVKPVISNKEVESSIGKDEMTRQSTGGTITEIKPNYLKNPVPVYPEEARRRGQEGLVLLNVRVDKMGRPQQIDIKKSSGFKSLDKSAVKGVWLWTFQAAKLGSIPVESHVDIPIRFQLNEN